MSRVRIADRCWAPFWFTLVLMCWLTTPTRAGEQLNWSPRGVFVFGTIVLDFERELEVFGPIRSRLVDCSTDEFFCATGRIVRLVVPRSCEAARSIKVGDWWLVRGVKTEVVARFDEQQASDLHPAGSGTVFVMGSKEAPHTVYEYDPSIGIRAIYFDSEQKRDLIAMATKVGNLSEVLRKEGAAFAWLYHPRLTLDPFGVCRTRR